MKKFQIIRDFVQYDMVINPIEDELKRRGWTIVTGTAASYNKDNDVKGSLGCQTGSWISAKPPISPSFLVFHGVSFIKLWSRPHPGWDYVIVASKFFEENVEGNALGLGWPQGDYYINNAYRQQEFKNKIKERHGLKDEKPIILFAPTYLKTSEKSAQLPGNPDKLLDIVSNLPHCNVIFMPHQMCDYKNKYEDYSLKVKSDYSNKYEYLLGCDLLIGDISSLVFEFSLLNKPVVLLNNPKIRNYLNVDGYNESLDLGDIISIDDFSKLREAVDNSISFPDRYYEKRSYWVDKALGYCDGKSTDRIVDKIEEICE